MKFLVLLFGLFAATMGALAVFTPAGANAIARQFANRGGLYAATVIRIVFGGAMWFAAAESRTPMTLRIIGAIIVITGVLIALLGIERHQRMIDWWLSAGRTIQFVWGLIALVFGVFLIYAIV
jgi:drug/metabolite transporter superfamily protein YnfA